MVNPQNHKSNVTILWWGRFDKDYSRNRILRQQMAALGYKIVDFHPRISSLADLEARLRGVRTADLVWVPCFRQRDVKAASRWARRRGIPLIFDPLISAWDKQVFERKKFAAESAASEKLLRREQRQFQQADWLVADTQEHARFFSDKFHIDPDRVSVIPVGTEEPLFHMEPVADKADGVTEVLFFGSFIQLQGPEVIVEAARLCTGLPMRWHLLGRGPLLEQCRQVASSLDNCIFEDWIDYQGLPARIHKADILLGIFGSSSKASRVIPNKVYQAIACARPVITRNSSAYPDSLQIGSHSGIYQIQPGDAQALAETVTMLASRRELIIESGRNARNTYDQFFSNAMIRQQLKDTIESVLATA